MSKLLLLMPLVVLITGCSDNMYAQFRAPEDKHGWWAHCVRDEYLKHKTSSPTLEIAIDKICRRRLKSRELELKLFKESH